MQIERVAPLEAAVKRNPNAANYRALADAYVGAHFYDRATFAFEQASAKYAALGDINAAKVLSDDANRYRTTAQIFFDQPTDSVAANKSFTGARLEPLYGCYIGANIERDDDAREPTSFNLIVKKPHSFFFMYRRYGVPFPVELARKVARVGAGLQIALEPDRLSDVQDDAYLHDFAKACREAGIPIFLRFAGEMNGEWTPYHGDPRAYIEKFRLVYQVMHQETKNVAMVWCPNSIPEHDIDKYFPGDDYVDWVGVNFYSVPFNDADRARGSEWRNPADSIDYVYRKYSAKHPIMIGEWAASHKSVVDNVQRPEFAANKIAQLYSALPRAYPRLKCANWLSMDTIKYAVPGRQLNDYSLLSNDVVTQKYVDMVSSPYFLSQASTSVANQSSTQILPATSGQSVPETTRLTAYVRTYTERPTVVWKVNGVQLARSAEPGEYPVSLSADSFKKGFADVELDILDAGGRVAGKSVVRLKKG